MGMNLDWSKGWGADTSQQLGLIDRGGGGLYYKGWAPL
jgi:hypothetical protein